MRDQTGLLKFHKLAVEVVGDRRLCGAEDNAHRLLVGTNAGLPRAQKAGPKTTFSLDAEQARWSISRSPLASSSEVLALKTSPGTPRKCPRQ